MAQEVIIPLFAAYGLVVTIFGVLMGYILAKMIIARDIENIIRSERKSAVSFSRAVIKGKISEQILPLLPFFKYNLGDARFLGSPIDYIVFNGYSEDNNFIKEIVFVEVKTGKSELSPTELAVKECIDSRRVRYEVINIDY
jgi:predicted Holliday junction resolvase-like endonuclease